MAPCLFFNKKANDYLFISKKSSTFANVLYLTNN